MIQGRWYPMGVDITQALCVREAVFGTGRDALDDAAQQVVVFDDGGEAVGAARLWWQDGAFWLGEVGVLAPNRGKGYGDLLVRLLIFKALTHEARQLRLCCPSSLTGFFERYGFRQSGNADGFADMLADAADIRLSHCNGCADCGEG